MNYGSEEAPINRAQQIPKLRGRQTGVATVAGQTMEVSLFASGELCRFLMNCSIGETLILEGPRISSSSVQWHDLEFNGKNRSERRRTISGAKTFDSSSSGRSYEGTTSTEEYEEWRSSITITTKFTKTGPRRETKTGIGKWHDHPQHVHFRASLFFRVIRFGNKLNRAYRPPLTPQTSRAELETEGWQWHR